MEGTEQIENLKDIIFSLTLELSILKENLSKGDVTANNRENLEPNIFHHTSKSDFKTTGFPTPFPLVLSSLKTKGSKHFVQRMFQRSKVRLGQEYLVQFMTIAIQQKNMQLINLCYRAGANLAYIPRSSHAAPIHFLINSEFKDIVKDILQDCSKNECLEILDSKDIKEGNTPLHIAFLKGNVDLASILIAEGADMSAKNKSQKHPIDLIQNKEIFALIEHTDNQILNLYSRGTLCYAVGKFDLSFEAYAQALQIIEKEERRSSINDSILLINAAKAASQLKLFSSAIEYINKAITLKKSLSVDVTYALELRAKLYEEAGRLDLALNDYEELQDYESINRVDQLQKDKQNLYLVLGVASNATVKDIRKNYKLKCRKYHPDKIRLSPKSTLFTTRVRNLILEEKKKGSEQKFKALSEAYGILNSENRFIYDAKLKQSGIFYQNSNISLNKNASTSGKRSGNISTSPTSHNIRKRRRNLFQNKNENLNKAKETTQEAYSESESEHNFEYSSNISSGSDSEITSPSDYDFEEIEPT